MINDKLNYIKIKNLLKKYYPLESEKAIHTIGEYIYNTHIQPCT